MIEPSVEREKHYIPRISKAARRKIIRRAAGITAFAASVSGCQTTEHTSVYYEPNAGTGVTTPASLTMTRAEWAKGNCAPDFADDFPSIINGKEVDTLAGWSLGRLGIAYFLETSTGTKRDQIKHLVYYDPANRLDYTTNTCDQRTPTQGAQLAAWLSANPEHHVTVFAGAYTVDAANPTDDGQTSAGVREVLFSDITGTQLANQVMVCEDTDAGHTEIIVDYGDFMNQPFNQKFCPAGTEMWRPDDGFPDAILNSVTMQDSPFTLAS